MIISRTPFRISFAGGGTDIRYFYKKSFGKVISSSIDKYIYVVVRKQTGIYEYKYRIIWNEVEKVNKINEIKHSAIRETLKYLNIDFPIEITTFADIPANTGLGSSSSLIVGLLNALYAMKGEFVTKYTLATQAAEIEVDILKRSIGKQDHFNAAYGNLNTYTFLSNEKVEIYPVYFTKNTIEKLSKNLILFYTDQKRDASKQIKSNKANKNQNELLISMRDNVDSLRNVIESGKIDEFGKILDSYWNLKKKSGNTISNKAIDNYYNIAKKNGALGGKLLGAGGGGFLLIYARIVDQKKIIKALNKLAFLKFSFDNSGSRITYYDR